jgi:regulator of sigma D
MPYKSQQTKKEIFRFDNFINEGNINERRYEPTIDNTINQIDNVCDAIGQGVSYVYNILSYYQEINDHTKCDEINKSITQIHNIIELLMKYQDELKNTELE